MKTARPGILVIDDETAICELFSRFLTDSGFEVKTAVSLAEARALITARSFDAVILDQFLADGTGMDFIGELRTAGPDMAIIMITGHGDIPLAVEAMQRGADNFLAKPVRLSDLKVIVQKSLEVGVLKRTSRACQVLGARTRPDFGSSPAMRSVMEVAGLASDSEAPLLITGETGAGKGVLARWIHDNGNRSASLFVEVNCSALRGELLASELFGHARGAFTSAVQDRQGLLDVANGGTLLLDEIGDMDIAIQAQFLKVIEDKTYRRLGEVKERKSNFRLICATNKDLEAEAAQGRFRKDLLYRIQVLPVRIPPLRERCDDIPGLVRQLLAFLNYQYRDVDRSVLSLLESYPWPGNVRELRNVLERAMLLSRGKALEPPHFPGLSQPAAFAAANERIKDLERVEMESIRAALDRCGGDVNKTAEALGVSRATIFRRLKKYQRAIQ
ncbi:MAG: sigma-54 dependent transcriptional regulator [Nitrospirota bacterium]|nr:sigma-54 dependent transcriptional regulator [Nitrospirota bacterium]